MGIIGGSTHYLVMSSDFPINFPVIKQNYLHLANEYRGCKKSLGKV